MDKLVALVRRVATDKVLLLALAALGYFLVLLVVYSYFKGLYFESIPVNGGFQHFNPIRRLWHGEIPGRDFIVFHGSGIPLLSLPIFAALGQNLFASEFSRYFLNGLFVFLGNFLFLSLFIRTRSSALLVSLLFTFVMSIGGYFWLLDPIGDAYSVLGIRTFFPLLALVVAKRLLDAQSLAGESTTMISSVRDVSVLGLFTAIAIFFGTEQGLAFCLAASAGIFFLYPVRGIARRFALAILQFASAAVSFVAIASVYSLGDPRPLLRHTFVDVPGDQIWFFGAPPSRMLTSLSDIYSTVADAIIMERMAIFSIALVGLVLMRRRFSRPELFVLWVAMWYAIVSLASNIGMYASHYFEALLRVSCFVIAIMVLRATRIVPERYSSAAPYGLFAALLVVVALSPHVNIATLVDAYAAKPTPAEKHSGIYLSGRVWDRYFETLERTLWAPAPLRSAASSHARAASRVFLADGRARYFRTGERAVILDSRASERTEHEILATDDASVVLSGEATGDTIMPAGAMRDRRSKRVTPSPFFSDDTYPDERLRGFSNGVAIRSDSVTFILENGPEEIAGFYPGDTLRLPDGQQAMIEEIYRSEVTVSASGLAVNQYTDGYPYRSTVVPDTTGKTAMPVQAIEHLSRIPQSAGISAHSGDIVYLDGQDSCRVRTVSDGDIYCRPEGSGTRSAPIVRQGDVWSMYSGLLEDTYGIFNPSGTDYVIHALGREGRADYVRKFTETKPRFVLTIRPDYMPHERWLEINYWPIYEELLRNYRIADFTGYSIIWERLGKPNDLDDTPWQQVAHDPDDANIILPKSERDEFVVVELTYSIDNPFASIPLVGNSPRYMVLPIDTETPLPVSLPPYQRTWTFDIAVRKWSAPVLRTDLVEPIPGIRPSFRIDSVRIRSLVPTEQARQALLHSRYVQD